MPKFVSVEEAVSHITDGATLAIGGFSTYGSPESLLEGLEERYAQTGHPKNLAMISGITPGDKTESTEPRKGYNAGGNRLKADGLLASATVGLSDARAIAYKMNDNKIAGYCMPMGILVNLYRTAAGGSPGMLTRVGLGTFCDPRIDGCAVNELARQRGTVVELMEINGEEYLFYKSHKPDVCFIRGTFADEDGNISIEQEVMIGAELDIAAATHNRGGIVIVQVGRVVQRGSIPLHKVRIHNLFVDYVVVAREPWHQSQSFLKTDYIPELTGELKCVLAEIKPIPLDERKVIARRSAMELYKGAVINCGVGMPAGVSNVASEEGVLSEFTTTVEAGPIGGVVLPGIFFPGTQNAEAIYSQPDITNMYDGGLLDITFLGAAEIDEKGNVNVSKFAGRSAGAGGFIDISQNSKKVVFMGVFTAGKPKPEYKVADGTIIIEPDGDTPKLVKKVQQITFSGEQSVKSGQEVVYVFERCVFKLTPGGLMLIEIAPGIDLEKDILAKMEFTPLISPDLKTMDACLFLDEKMGLVLGEK